MLRGTLGRLSAARPALRTAPFQLLFSRQLCSSVARPCSLATPSLLRPTLTQTPLSRALAVAAQQPLRHALHTAAAPVSRITLFGRTYTSGGPAQPAAGSRGSGSGNGSHNHRSYHSYSRAAASESFWAAFLRHKGLTFAGSMSAVGLGAFLTRPKAALAQS
jgi:hypothetical protein